MHHKAFGGWALPEPSGELTGRPRSQLNLEFRGWVPQRGKGRRKGREGKEGQTDHHR